MLDKYLHSLIPGIANYGLRANPTHTCFYMTANWLVFAFFKWLKKAKRRITFYNTWNDIKFKFSYPQIKYYWDTAALIYLCIVYDSFCAITTQLSSCDRDYHEWQRLALYSKSLPTRGLKYYSRGCPEPSGPTSEDFFSGSEHHVCFQQVRKVHESTLFEKQPPTNEP